MTNTRLRELIDYASKGEFHKVRDTWFLLGEFTVNNQTKVYIKDTIIKVKTGNDKGLDGAILYIRENYNINTSHQIINWDKVERSNLESLVTNVDGVITPAFYCILDKDEFNSITEPLNLDFEPFETEKKLRGFNQTYTDVLISDLDLQMIMSEIGVPFLSFDEVEYSRETICNMCVRPALERYFREKPILKRTSMGPFSGGQKIEFKLPPNCTGIRRAEFRQGGVGSGSNAFTGAFSFMNEQYILGTGIAGSKFGKGLNYKKPVPGYVGVDAAGSRQSLSMLQRAASQAVTNYHKRVRFDIEINEDGEKIASGYTTIGGTLDIEFKFWSLDFRFVDFDDKELVRKHAKAYVMRNLGALRALVKSDTPGSIDFTGYANRAQSLEDEVNKYYDSRPKVVAIRG